MKTETPFVKRFFPLIAAFLMIALGASPALATIDDALSFALEAATPYVKEGFTVREDYWGGDLPVKTTKAIVHQLFKGNEYWFWMGTETKNAKISVHVYDSDGESRGSGSLDETALRGGPGGSQEDRFVLSDRRNREIPGRADILVARLWVPLTGKMTKPE